MCHHLGEVHSPYVMDPVMGPAISKHELCVFKDPLIDTFSLKRDPFLLLLDQ